MDAIHRGPDTLWTPQAGKVGAFIGTSLITWIVVSDTFNLPGALTHWVNENEGFTPHQSGLWDWILNSDADIPYDDMTPAQKEEFHERQLEQMRKDYDDALDNGDFDKARDIEGTIEEEEKALESLRRGGPGYPPYPGNLN